MHPVTTVAHIAHVLSAVVLVGGLFFLRVVLMRAAARSGGLSEDLREALARKWLHVAWGFFLILVVTGLVSLMPSLGAWKAPTAATLFGASAPHLLFGLKFLLILGVGTVLFLLNQTLKPARRGRRPLLLAINLALGLSIVILSAWLRRSY